MIVIIHSPYGDIEKGVGFTDEQEAVEYARPYLKSWDIYNEGYQQAVADAATIEDIQTLIEEEAIYTLQVLVVTEINPKLDPSNY